MTGTVFALGYALPAVGADPVSLLTATEAESQGIELNAFISIDEKGIVTIVNHRAEMGQGSFQSVPQMIAEELEVDLANVKIIFGEANERKYGSQMTGGSSTIRGAYTQLSKLGASAREMLIEAAAKKWQVTRAECYAENGFVIHKPSGKKIHYGELVKEASTLTPPTDVKLKSRSEYKILRKPLPRKDTPLKTNGAAIFGIDKKLLGMLYAVVERNPRFIGKVKSFDAEAAKAIPGVKHVFVVKMPVFAATREGVAVVADTTWAAMQGRKVLNVVWDDSGFDHPSTESLYTGMRESLKQDGISFRTKGNTISIFQTSQTIVEAVYETPYESHSCMEPMNCVADVKEDSCEIWGPIQGPAWIKGDLSQRLGLPEDKVKVNMTFLGGGFGRKAFTDYTAEAALISKEIKAPVQVVWTREDDMTQGPFRPGMVYQCKAALSGNGRLLAFETKMAGQNMDHQWPGADKKTYNSSVTEGFPEPLFETIPHYRFSDVPLDVHIPVMWWRSVYSSTNVFAYESFIDELAAKAQQDPMQYRKRLLNTARYQELLNALESKSGWKDRTKNSGWGLAVGECFSSIVGEVVKVSKNASGKLVIDKVVVVMDCGWYVNPDIIKAQVEGSIVMALGAAIKHETHFENGKAVERNFDSYKMPRIHEIPPIEIHIMENDERAGGVGEPALPPFTPALCNAIYDLTGKRIRKLPFSMDEV